MMVSLITPPRPESGKTTFEYVLKDASSEVFLWDLTPTPTAYTVSECFDPALIVNVPVHVSDCPTFKLPSPAGHSQEILCTLSRPTVVVSLKSTLSRSSLPEFVTLNVTVVGFACSSGMFVVKTPLSSTPFSAVIIGVGTSSGRNLTRMVDESDSGVFVLVDVPVTVIVSLCSSSPTRSGT